MPASETTVLFVKKLLPGGAPCAKCVDIERRLHNDGLMRHIDHVVIAEEDIPSSTGMELAKRLGVESAPFFVVRTTDGVERVIESYLAFKRRYSDDESTADDLADAVDRQPDLAFI